MLSFKNMNDIWRSTLRSHAKNPMEGERGAYLPIGAKSIALLEALWGAVEIEKLPDLGGMLREGKDVRFFGDPHFEHENIIRLCSRDFETVAAMDRTIRQNVMDALSSADFVLCLGDLSLKNPIAEQRKLFSAGNGKVLTIVGNHDAKGAKPGQWVGVGATGSLAFSLPLETIRGWILEDEPEMAEFVDWGCLPETIYFGCSHWPVPPERLPGPAWMNIHGHIHNRPDRPLRLNFSVEAIGYRPATLRQKISAQALDDLARRQAGLESWPQRNGNQEESNDYREL